MIERVLICIILWSLLSCGGNNPETTVGQEDGPTEAPLFRRLSATESGIDFSNDITETREYNYFRFQYVYNGAGVAVGDIDNDGLLDLFFTGNQVQDRLYKNLGSLQFEDITENAGIQDSGGFNFGTVMVDIDQDGWMDIYVCRSGHAGLDSERANRLYINQRDGTFKEEAEQYGLADRGFSIQSAFFDYDRDGDLDMYLTNHPVDYGQNLQERLDRMANPDPWTSDKLYRNKGNGKFEDVTKSAGLANYGHGLGPVIWDINDDDWPDIYVGNDYQSPDYAYINNADGTFSDRNQEMFPHIPYYSMGVDVGDLDNDGLEDLAVMEMLPGDRMRRTMNLTDISEERYHLFVKLGFHHQYMRNGLFVNRGDGRFTDVAPYAGVAATDWSWSTLIADFDLDGRQDIHVTNGYLRDMQDKDYMKRAKEISASSKKLSKSDFDRISGSVKLRNHLFLNRGSMRFEDAAENQGMGERLFSNGAAYADLDNDGDLDMVLSNTNLQLAKDPAIVYENTMDSKGRYLTLELEGFENRTAEGLKVILHTDLGKMVRTVRGTRGFQSGSDTRPHFGFPVGTELEKLEVFWPDGRYQSVNDPSPGFMKLDYGDSDEPLVQEAPTTSFIATKRPGLKDDSNDRLLNEFDLHPQLPFRMTMPCPAVAMADVNGDGLDDLFITSAAAESDHLFMQKMDVWSEKSGPWKAWASEEHAAAAFFDADNDGDQDLLIAGGSAEFGPNDAKLQDRLLINEGGRFVWDEEALPRMFSASSVICAADFDSDGDTDVFIGSRAVPKDYGKTPFSFLLVNENGRFTSKATEFAPGLSDVGMVTAATHGDVDGDGDDDLLVATEWGPLYLFEQKEAKLEKKVLWPETGLWRSIELTDIGSDGRMDILLGNLGSNSQLKASKEHPLRMYRGDLDKDGRVELLLSAWQGDGYYPFYGFKTMSGSFDFLEGRYPYIEPYAEKDVQGLFDSVIDKAELLEAQTLEHRWLIIDDEVVQGRLPYQLEFSSINDWEKVASATSENEFVAFIGNERLMPVEIGSQDGHYGGLLSFSGTSCRYVQPGESGISVEGWGRRVVSVETSEGLELLFITSDKGIKTYRESPSGN